MGREQEWNISSKDLMELVRLYPWTCPFLLLQYLCRTAVERLGVTYL